MDPAAIAAWLNDTLTIRYPGWTMTAEVNPNFGPNGTVVVARMDLHTPDTSRPGHMINQFRVRLIDPADITCPADLERWVTWWLCSLACHEILEAVRVGPDEVAPYHPHTSAGQAAWARDGAGILAALAPV